MVNHFFFWALVALVKSVCSSSRGHLMYYCDSRSFYWNSNFFYQKKKNFVIGEAVRNFVITLWKFCSQKMVKENIVLLKSNPTARKLDDWEKQIHRKGWLGYGSTTFGIFFFYREKRILLYIDDEKLTDDDFTFNCFKNLLVDSRVTTEVPKCGSGGNCSDEIIIGKYC